MAALGRLVLGIDINPVEICVVEVKGNWPDAQISSIGTIPVPERAFRDGKIVDPALIAEALKSLLEQIGTPTRDAVIGVMEGSVLTRIIDIPPVPDHELRPVIEGELAHFKVASGGAFDFIRLAKSDDKKDATLQALVMATEQDTLQVYRTIADMAGLTILALEPRLVSMYRAAMPDLAMHDGGVIVSIGSNETEIVINRTGQIRLYRRVDLGRNQLVVGQLNVPQNKRVSFDMLGEKPQEDSVGGSFSQIINPSTASALTIEIQRSLDYYNNDAEENPINRVIISTVHSELASLGTWLTQAIPMETVISTMPMVRALAESVAMLLTPPAGLRYLCAIGLGMHELSNIPGGIPLFDLSMQQKKLKDQSLSMRRVAISMAASFAAILLGGAMAIGLFLQAGRVEKDSIKLKKELVVLEKKKKDLITSKQAEQDQFRNLRKVGLPFARVMDEVNGALMQNVGIVSASLDGAGRLQLNGEAIDQKDIDRTAFNLSNIKYFESVSTDSFDRYSPKEGVFLMRFQLSCQLKSRKPAPAPVPTN